MNEAIKKWWLSMSEPRLRRHLVDKLKYPPETVAILVQQVNAEKLALKKERISRSVGLNLWDDFLSAARYEVQIVRVLKSQLKKAGGEGSTKWETLCAYEYSVATTVERIKETAKALGATPQKLPAMLHAQGHQLPRNNGEHWTDYVKKSEIARITALFDQLPPPPRGRTKTPYTRALPPKLYTHKKIGIIKRLNEEIEGAERERAVAEHPEDIERLDAMLDRMYEAQYRIDQHPKNTPLPPTWHGFVK